MLELLRRRRPVSTFQAPDDYRGFCFLRSLIQRAGIESRALPSGVPAARSAAEERRVEGFADGDEGAGVEAAGVCVGRALLPAKRTEFRIGF